MYQYNNGIRNISQEILPHFKRFHNCNAQYHEFIFKGKEHGMSTCVDSETYTLISYSTWLIHASHTRSGWIVYLNINAYNYSTTTTRHLNRFLNECHIPMNMKDIKIAVKEAVKENTNLVWCNGAIIRFMTSDSLCDMWHRIYEHV